MHGVEVPSRAWATNLPGRRRIQVDGALNFRDLGGYRGADGRRVRWGQVYRSGTLSRLTPEGVKHISRLGVRSVCDLRGAREREREPSMLAALVGVSYWAQDHNLAAGNLTRMLRDAKATPEDIRRRMIDSYRSLPFDYAESYAVLFARIAAGELPLIFNCAGGKDRTGIAAALLLDMLGVSRRTIARDYRLTEFIIDADRRRASGDRTKLYAFADHVPPEVVRPLMRSDPAYLNAAFAALEERWGSSAAYLAEIGVNKEQSQRIRDALLTPA